MLGRSHNRAWSGQALVIEDQEPRQPSPVRVAAPPSKASARSSVLTIINCAVGAAVLSLPYAFQQAGWFAGIVLTGRCRWRIHPWMAITAHNYSSSHHRM